MCAYFSSSLLHLLLLLAAVALLLPHCAVLAQKGIIPQRDLWCVAKNNAPDQALHSAIDWACGAGGANCGPIQQGGPCYDSSDVQTTASWAFNDYYLNHGLTDDACYFSNTAALTSLNPSHGNCKFPSSSAVNNGSFSGSTATVTTGTDSADLSSCGRTAGTWFWRLIVSCCVIVLFTLVNHWSEDREYCVS